LSVRRADGRYNYGYDRITFFSAGFEGGMIMLAALVIIWEAANRWIAGLTPTSLPLGAAIVAAASVINLVLGWYLVSLGRRINSLIIEANGKHVLTDSWTSFGVVGGLILVILTGWPPFDPLLAIFVALNILWSGFGLVQRSFRGLMDYTEPDLAEAIRNKLDEICRSFDIEYHELRSRHTGSRVMIEVHLVFPYRIYLGRAHAIATMVEEQLEKALDCPCSVVTHLESMEDHDSVHKAAF
jgi:cation diffusion facilitator family transporter